MLLLERIQAAQMPVPVCFECVGHQTIVGIHFEIAPARKFSLVASPFKLRAAQRVGLFDACGDLIVHGQCNLQCSRRHSLQQQGTDRGIDIASADGLA